jgi:hypothetical protein
MSSTRLEEGFTARVLSSADEWRLLLLPVSSYSQIHIQSPSATKKV